MPLRGPYKQYEVDASIAVPKSTFYDRRKRRFVEVDIGNADAHSITDREESDDNDFHLQVRFRYIFIVLG